MIQPPPLRAAVAAAHGRWRRHWRWALPLAVIAVTAAVAAVVWLALARWSQWSRGSEPYQEAMRRARCSVELVAALGEPIQDGYLPTGSMHSHSSGSGNSQFLVHLHGPHGSARMFMAAKRDQGQWDYPMLYVLIGQAEPIDLTTLDDAEAAGECALEECREQGRCATSGRLI